MKKLFIKLIILMIFLFNIPTYAKTIISPRVLYNQSLNSAVEDWKNVDVRENNQFLEAVKSLRTYQESDTKRTMFNTSNKNLLIGHSATVFAMVNAKDILIKKGYDLVGVGGAIDKQICEWFDLLNKKYDNIIIWGAANDIMNAVVNQTGCTDEYFKILDNVLIKAYEHLNHDNPNSKIVWVCVRPMEAGLDMPYEYCVMYNPLAEMVNNYVIARHIKCINIPQDTTSYNSAWYMHYTNQEVFRDILDMKYMFN